MRQDTNVLCYLLEKKRKEKQEMHCTNTQLRANQLPPVFATRTAYQKYGEITLSRPELLTLFHVTPQQSNMQPHVQVY
jgi:hypothetical protein